MSLSSLFAMSALFLGLAAWILPVIALIRGPGRTALPAVSLGACALSLLMVLFALAHMVSIGDLSALMDTIGAFRLAAAVLVVGALALNAWAWARSYAARKT